MGAPVAGGQPPLPTVLEPQAFSEVAAEIVLPQMPPFASQVDPDLAPDIDPAAAERIVLRQMAAGVRIDHAVEKQPMQVRLLERTGVTRQAELVRRLLPK